MFEFDVQYAAGDRVLRASAQIPNGEVAVVQGPSGLGKTTLLRVLCGLELLQHGWIKLDGLPVENQPPERRGFGWIPQNGLVLDSLSPLENMILGLRARGHSKRSAVALVMPWVERWGLTDAIRNPTATLSGGEVMRISWIRAWAVQPRVLLMDEPFSGLNREWADRMWADLDRSRAAALIVTHHAEDLMRVRKANTVDLRVVSVA